MGKLIRGLVWWIFVLFVIAVVANVILGNL